MWEGAILFIWALFIALIFDNGNGQMVEKLQPRLEEMMTSQARNTCGEPTSGGIDAGRYKET